jgi:hypothetical protein
MSCYKASEMPCVRLHELLRAEGYLRSLRENSERVNFSPRLFHNMENIPDKRLPSGRGRPRTSKVELLRVALTFSRAKELSGGTLRKLADAYGYEMSSARAEDAKSEVKPFSQYIRMMRTSSPKDDRSRLSWVQARYRECQVLYCSPLFELLESNCSREDLLVFTHDLWIQRRIAPAVLRPSLRSLSFALGQLLNQVLWSGTRDVERVKEIEHLDALCLLLIAQRASTDPSEKNHLSQWVDDWLKRWARSHSDMQDANAGLDALVRGYVHSSGGSKLLPLPRLPEAATEGSLIAAE